MPDTHHEFSPSGAQRLVSCPGSYKMQRGRKERENDAAAEGTMLHAIMAGNEPTEELDAEQQACLEKCLEYAKAVTPEGAIVLLEQKAKVHHNFALLTEGTADYVAILGDHAVLIDWKFGRGDVQSPAANYQLALYAAGIAQKHRLKSVECHIFQPRVFETAEPFTYTDFDAIAARYAHAVMKATGPGMELLAGKHCQYCLAAEACPELWLSAEEETDAAPTPDLVHAENAQEVFEGLTSVKIWLKAVEQRIKDLVLADDAPGLAIKEKAGRRNIEDAQAAFNAVQHNLSKDEFMELVSVSAAQLENAVVKSLREKHEKLKVKEARKIAKDLIKPVVTYGNPSQSVEVAS